MDALSQWFGLPQQLPTSFDPTHGWTLSWLLPICVAGVLVARALVLRRGSRPSAARARRALDVLLIVSSLLCVPLYADFGVFRYDTYYNEWDVYHYYLGSKYAPELGYQRLYEATLVADADTGLEFAHDSGKIRDLSTLQYESVDEVLARSEALRARFTPSRWREFVADVQFFRAALSTEKWSGLLRDHGYNGTPAWSAVVGTLFTSHLSIRSPWQRAVLVGLDPLLFLLTFAVVWRVFGWRAVAACTVLVGTHYLLSWGHLKGCLLRTDFALLSVMAVAMVKRERYRLAGVLLGLATLSRVFPAVLLAGLGVHGLAVLVKERRLDRALLGLLGAFLATLALGVVAGAAYGGQSSLWGEWIPKILDHYDSKVDWNMGYQAIANAKWRFGEPTLVDWREFLAEEPDELALRMGLVRATQLVLAIPALFFAQALRRWEATAFGFVYLFLFVQVTYYYYLFLLVPMLFFVGRADELPRALGAAWMLLSGAIGYALFMGVDALDGLAMFRGWQQMYPTYYFMSWFIGLACVYMLGLAGAAAHRAQADAMTAAGALADATPADEPG